LARVNGLPLLAPRGADLLSNAHNRPGASGRITYYILKVAGNKIRGKSLPASAAVVLQVPPVSDRRPPGEDWRTQAPRNSAAGSSGKPPS